MTSGARLHVADLVHAGALAIRRKGASDANARSAQCDRVVMGFRTAIVQPRLIRTLMFGTIMLLLAAGGARLRLSR